MKCGRVIVLTQSKNSNITGLRNLRSHFRSGCATYTAAKNDMERSIALTGGAPFLLNISQKQRDYYCVFGPRRDNLDAWGIIPP